MLWAVIVFAAVAMARLNVALPPTAFVVLAASPSRLPFYANKKLLFSTLDIGGLRDRNERASKYEAANDPMGCARSLA